MIGKTNVGGGGESLSSRVILGAPGETITYAGGNSGTTTLNSSGIGSIKLPNGTYQFNSSLSEYRKITTIDKETSTIYLRPLHFIYWYGLWAFEPKCAYYDNGEIQYAPGIVQQSDASFQWNYPKKNKWCGLYIENDCSNFKSCTLKYKGLYANNWAKLVYTDGINPNYYVGDQVNLLYPSSTTRWRNTTLNFTPVESGRTIKLCGYYENSVYYLNVQEWYFDER